jgi:hypothetical protein
MNYRNKLIYHGLSALAAAIVLVAAVRMLCRM